MDEATQQAYDMARELADSAVLLADVPGKESQATANGMAAIAQGLAALAASIAGMTRPETRGSCDVTSVKL